jgi:hypothetical protein
MLLVPCCYDERDTRRQTLFIRCRVMPDKHRFEWSQNRVRPRTRSQLHNSPNSHRWLSNTLGYHGRVESRLVAGTMPDLFLRYQNRLKSELIPHRFKHLVYVLATLRHSPSQRNRHLVCPSLATGCIMQSLNLPWAHTRSLFPEIYNVIYAAVPSQWCTTVPTQTSELLLPSPGCEICSSESTAFL